MTMPPFAEDPEESRPHFAALRELAAEHGLRHLSMGTSQDYRVAAEEGATIVRVGIEPVRVPRLGWLQGTPARPRTPTRMAFRDTWHRTLVYFGLAEDREHVRRLRGAATPASPRRSSRAATASGRTSAACSSRRRRDEIDDIFADDSPSERRTRAAALGRLGGGTATAPRQGNGRDVRVHLVIPKSFNDAQDVADKFKDSIPVILNLQGSDTDLSKRLIDFASGLTYALDGGMQRIADKVFLLTPRNVEVSAEERARLIEKGFFNQS